MELKLGLVKVWSGEVWWQVASSTSGTCKATSITLTSDAAFYYFDCVCQCVKCNLS